MSTMFTLLAGLVILWLVLSWFLAPEGWARWVLGVGRTVSGLRSRTASVNGLAWHYLSGGTGPALLAIHGFGGDADHWLRVAPTLRRHFRIIAPDLVGFGSSDPGNDLPFAIDAQVDRLVALMDKLGIEEFVVAGSSMGGWIASRLAERYPDRVNALWLLAPLGVRDCERGELLKRIEGDHASPFSIASIADFEKHVFQPMFARPPHLPWPLKYHYGRQAVARAKASRRMFADVIASEPPLENTIANLPIPVLVQWGSEDRAVHVSGAKRLKRVLDSGIVIIQPGVGHLPMLEAAHLSAGQFMEFARQHGLVDPAS